MNAQKPVGEDPALQEVPELSLDEARRRAAPIAGLCEKRLELLRDDLVKDGLVCPAGRVGGRGDASGSSGGKKGPRSGEAVMLALIGCVTPKLSCRRAMPRRREGEGAENMEPTSGIEPLTC
jgi:hypothetical protein